MCNHVQKSLTNLWTVVGYVNVYNVFTALTMKQTEVFYATDEYQPENSSRAVRINRTKTNTLSQSLIASIAVKS